MKRLHLIRELSDDDVAAMAQCYLTDAHYWKVVRGEPVSAYKPDGTLLFTLLPQAIPDAVASNALPACRKAARVSLRRGSAAGGWYRRMKLDGTISRTTYSQPVQSGVVGFLDRTPNDPDCRQTAFTAKHFDHYRQLVPLARTVNSIFAAECPERYRAQATVASHTAPDWIIPGTSFTTLTVNRNYRTSVHVDRGDLAEGFGAMAVLRSGRHSGGELVFPKYGIAVDLGHRDVLLADVHEYHGNTETVGEEGQYERISVVCYYRTNMRHCGTAADELERLKRRQPGDRLF